ncbi:hypothetical protein ACP70R_028314 [Stipagrostis hirtigluma subsp. patula]
MDYDPGGASPDHNGGGGTIHLVCEYCGAGDDYEPDDAENGFFTCRQCSAVHTSTQATAADPYDFPAAGNISIRRVATQPTPAPKPHAQTPGPHRTPYAATPAAGGPAFDGFDEPSEPRDFALGAGAWGEPEELAARIRWRYVRGLQVILQEQLEVLVKQHRVSALVCGVAGTVWVRWVAASKVFDEMWARQLLADHEAVEYKKQYGDDKKPEEVKYEWEDDILPLRKDKRKWAMEGKIPYVAGFTQVDRLLGSTLQDCPLDARQLFRPVRVIGAWQLEAAAGSIAQRVGLRLPAVNFYAIAQRCLKDLSLPIDRILPHACKIYEWTMPAELWLSSNPARIPTRVCVMAILIVALRVLYNINGQGIWEKICEGVRNAGGSDPDTNSAPSMKPDCSNSEEFGSRELLCAFAAAYDKINVGHDYSNDLCSYLKYCKEIIFAGITYSAEEEHLIEIFWDMYKGIEGKNSKEHVKSQSQGTEKMTMTTGVNKRYRDGTVVEASCFSATSGHDAMQVIKSEMQDHGFHYLPPKNPRISDGYLRYRRRRLTGGFVYVAHADYYMLLRAFAKLAEVDARIMHTSVLKLERRLACIEERIERSLNTLRNPSSKTEDELRPVAG